MTGKYHVDGDSPFDPTGNARPLHAELLPYFDQLTETPMIFLSPLPRYLTFSCCDDHEHDPNRQESGFRSTIGSGAERLHKATRKQLLASGVRNFKVNNALSLLAGPKTTDEAL
jgi:hypothetical protein